MSELFTPTVNFVILVGGLVYFLRNPLKNFVKTRRDVIQKEVEEAQKKKEEAEKKLHEFEKKLHEFESEAKTF